VSLQKVIRSVTSRAGVVRVRNAFNPILWGCAVATPVCFLFAGVLGTDPILRYGFAALGGLPVLTLVGAYIYFMLRDPDRLQSEEFVLRQQELTVTERKGLPTVTHEPRDVDEAGSEIVSTEERP